MTFFEFKDSLTQKIPPHGLPDCLAALWYDANGDWEKAHTIVQNADDEMADCVHAYLHRKQGDYANAAYWYQQAGQLMLNKSLDEEWTELVSVFFTDKYLKQ